jgi:hypothetical protein
MLAELFLAAKLYATEIATCDRTINRWHYWSQAPAPAEEGWGILSEVTWEVPTGEEECLAIYQITANNLRAVQADIICNSPSEGTLICGDAISTTAHATFWGIRQPNFITDSVLTWFYFTYRFVLPITVT